MTTRLSQISIRYRDLPHWERENATYFITFRLRGSLPRHIVAQAQREVAATLTAAARKQQLRRWSDNHLDRSAHDILSRPQCARIVADALYAFHRKRYNLHAWCVMPNHVHVVAQVLPVSSLAEVLHGWKSYSARLINEALGRKGHLWQREYFDRLLRNGDEFARAVSYT